MKSGLSSKGAISAPMQKGKPNQRNPPQAALHKHQRHQQTEHERCVLATTQVLLEPGNVMSLLRQVSNALFLF